eukprot:6686095-Prymnesium_polylepis.2
MQQTAWSAAWVFERKGQAHTVCANHNSQLIVLDGPGCAPRVAAVPTSSVRADASDQSDRLVLKRVKFVSGFRAWDLRIQGGDLLLRYTYTVAPENTSKLTQVLLCW